jgi:hypothetical protein
MIRFRGAHLADNDFDTSAKGGEGMEFLLYFLPYSLKDLFGHKCCLRFLHSLSYRITNAFSEGYP